MRNHVSKNNVKKKHAGYSGRPLNSTGRLRRARTLTSPACIGGRNLRFTKRPQAHDINSLQSRTKGDIMDTDTLTFAFVIVALGIAGVAIYMKGK